MKALPYIVVALVLAAIVVFSRPGAPGAKNISNNAQMKEAVKQVTALSGPQIEKYDLGGTLTEKDLSDLRAAIPFYRQLSQFEPNNWHPYFAMGKIYHIFGEDENAEPMFNECLKLVDQEKNPQLIKFAHNTAVETIYQLSEIAQKKGDAQEAYRLADKAAKEVPNSPPYRTQRASALIELRRIDEAKKELAAALKLDPNYPKAITLAKFLLSAPATKKP